ncbi:MAG: hypothetical protein KBF17_14955 [Candidatus Promineofilum sp.]|nr:hypothetical protein [Promineifilum sp.]
MTSTLHDAIAAVRAGDLERAQLIAADIVYNNPDDSNAWYLMSQLVDSDARRAAYLNKTLSLNPAHPRAAAELAALPSGVIGALSEAPAASAAPAAVAEAAVEEVELAPQPAPAWETAVPPAAPTRPEPVAAYAPPPARTADEEAFVEEVASSAPEWLWPLSPQQVAVERQTTQQPEGEASRPMTPRPATPPTAQPAAAKPAAPRPRKPAPAKKSNNTGLTLLLGVLGLLTILVLAVLFYLLIFS